ncbi:hypothetical protein GCM10018966_067710 [Streptomyces yanii]
MWLSFLPKDEPIAKRSPVVIICQSLGDRIGGGLEGVRRATGVSGFLAEPLPGGCGQPSRRRSGRCIEAAGEKLLTKTVALADVRVDSHEL